MRQILLLTILLIFTALKIDAQEAKLKHLYSFGGGRLNETNEGFLGAYFINEGKIFVHKRWAINPRLAYFHSFKVTEIFSPDSKFRNSIFVDLGASFFIVKRPILNLVISGGPTLDFSRVTTYLGYHPNFTPPRESHQIENIRSLAFYLDIEGLVNLGDRFFGAIAFQHHGQYYLEVFGLVFKAGIRL